MLRVEGVGRVERRRDRKPELIIRCGSGPAMALVLDGPAAARPPDEGFLMRFIAFGLSGRFPRLIEYWPYPAGYFASCRGLANCAMAAGTVVTVGNRQAIAIGPPGDLLHVVFLATRRKLPEGKMVRVVGEAWSDVDGLVIRPATLLPLETAQTAQKTTSGHQKPSRRKPTN